MNIINVKDNGKNLVHYWSKCTTAGRANECLRAAWQEQFKTVVKECGFKYIRFHGLFHEDMCVYRVEDGKKIYNYQYIDELFDMLLSNGVRPVVELSFMPYDMALGNDLQFWWKNNVSPPKNWDDWGELIEKSVSHWVERYGLKEVKKWYFEVWNEANLSGAFWTGTKSDYFKMYEISAKAIKSVHNELKVGGPATSNFVPDDRFSGETDDTSKHMTHYLENLDDADWRPVWFDDFIRFCYENKLPIDFFSAHPYPTDFALDGHGESNGKSRKAESTTDDLKLIREIVDASPYKDAEIILTEWSSSPSPRDHSHDYAPAAAFIVKENIESRGYVDALAYWTFTDIFEEGGAGDTAFHGGFGMINYQGIKKPSYHAYRFLNNIGDTELLCSDNYIVTKSSETERVSVLAWNYESDIIKTAVPMSKDFEAAETVAGAGKETRLAFKLTGLKPGTAFVTELVDNDNGCAMELYKKLGYPSSLTQEQIRILKNKANAVKTDIIRANENGELVVDTTLPPWAILLINEI